MAAPGLNCSMQTLSCDTWDRVPRPGIKPGPPVLGAWSRNHWTTREIPAWCFFNMSCSRKKKTPPFWPLGYEHMSKFTCPRALPSQTPVKKHSLKGFWLPWLSSEQWLLSQLGLGSPEWIWVGVCPGTAPGLVLPNSSSAIFRLFLSYLLPPQHSSLTPQLRPWKAHILISAVRIPAIVFYDHQLWFEAREALIKLLE